MLDGKSIGCSQWFLSREALEKPTARRVRVKELMGVKQNQKEKKWRTPHDRVVAQHTGAPKLSVSMADKNIKIS